MPCEAAEWFAVVFSILVPLLFFILKKLFELSNHTSHILAKVEDLDTRIEALEKKTSDIAQIRQHCEKLETLSGIVDKIQGYLACRNGFSIA